MATRRNDLCPCGSGEKYKRCCEKGRSSRLGPGALILAAIVLGGLAVTVFATLRAPESKTPQRVWSSEHGHWHNVDGQDPPATTGEPAPQPPGPAPPGKVWSPEHRHWHDAG